MLLLKCAIHITFNNNIIIIIFIIIVLFLLQTNNVFLEYFLIVFFWFLVFSLQFQDQNGGMRFIWLWLHMQTL